MKKTVSLLLLLSGLLIAGCVATREVPLTEAPDNYGPHVLAEALKNAPMLPREVDDVQYIDIPDTFKWAEKGYTFTEFCTPFTDLIDQVDMLALEPISRINISNIYDVRSDDGLLFVSFSSKIPENELEPKGNRYLYDSNRFAIFTNKGKFVALLGEPLSPAQQRQYFKSNPPQAVRTHELQYKNVALCLNQKDKEVVLVCSEGKRNLHFDYKGNYLRTTYFPFSSNNCDVNNTRGKWFANIVDDEDNNVLLSLDDSMKVKHKMVMGKGWASNYMDRMDDDFYHMGNNYDTIWHITPEKAVARYVLAGNLKTKPFVITKDTVAERKAIPYFKVVSYKDIIANSKYLYIPLERVYDRTETSRMSNPFYYLLDQETGHFVVYWYIYHQYGPHPVETFSHWMLYARNESPMIQHDGRQVWCFDAYDMKKKMAHLLEMPEKERKVIITKKDEKFVHSLLPDQYVLFFVKLKKF